jgi:hypothetical protein
MPFLFFAMRILPCLIQARRGWVRHVLAAVWTNKIATVFAQIPVHVVQIPRIGRIRANGTILGSPAESPGLLISLGLFVSCQGWVDGVPEVIGRGGSGPAGVFPFGLGRHPEGARCYLQAIEFSNDLVGSLATPVASEVDGHLCFLYIIFTVDYCIDITNQFMLRHPKTLGQGDLAPDLFYRSVFLIFYLFLDALHLDARIYIITE